TDKLTTKFQQALGEAQSLAVGRDNPFLEPVHVMLSLLDQEGGSARALLNKMNINTANVRGKLEEALLQLPQVQGAAEGEVHISNELNRLLNLTDKLAQQRKDQFISSELFLLAACDDQGVLGNILKKAGINKNLLAKAIEEMRGGENIQDPGAEE